MSSAIQPTARLIEVFSAIQGEGLQVGTRQLFIRFALCDLRCYFCDSAHTWSVPEVCHVEQTPGDRNFETYPNPVSERDMLKWIERLNQPGLHDSISLTGGEPLLHAPFLVQFLPQVRQLTQLPVYLETGGHRPQELAMVLPYLDSVGMDIKLPSVSGEERWLSHAEFLLLCRSSSLEVFVKLIIDCNTNSTELEQSAQLVADIDPQIPVFLQPVTPVVTSEYCAGSPLPEQVLVWQGLMKRTLKQVRVVPQTHKMIGQL
ncbi:MAG: 7-carboxy-7-deazaguanine synthase QueE [Symploca sp. SIO2E9]|nr:7-carboxy-7-deazaguanine synthase QueE [Symploca sp. SIO2E9]